MAKEITAQRLIELGSALEAILKELADATPPPNPKTKRNKAKELHQERKANFLNFLDSKTYKKRIQ
ncbi:MAG: hypothetical protein WCG93_13970 [Paludibacter sp.]